MRKSIMLTTVLAAIIATAFFACNSSTATTAIAAAIPDSLTKVKRGEYLVNAIGCDDCHSPKRMGAHGPEVIPELRLSGFQAKGQLPPVDTGAVKKGWALFAPDLTAAVGPWGISYAANLTSDGSGLGNWKEENFIRAIREGKYKGLEGSRPLLPPMPWTVYRNLSDDDLKSIFAYLKTVKAVNNVVPAPKPLAQ